MRVTYFGVEYGELVKLERQTSKQEELYELSVFDRKKGVTHLFDNVDLKNLRLFGRPIFGDEKTTKAIETVIAKGDRVELIPVKDGVKVVRVRREEVKK